MILEELIVYSRSNCKILKRYPFNTVGVNIILGIKKEKEEESNRVGKTSFVESIRYLLGSRIPDIFKKKSKILEEDITLILTVSNNRGKLYLARVISDENIGYINRTGELNFNIHEWEQYKDKQYKDEVEKIFMSGNKIANPPTFAALREYLIRDEKKGFNDITLSRKAVNQYKVLAYLFGLDGSAENEISKLKEKEKTLNDRIKFIDSIVSDIATLRVKEKKLTDELKELTDISQKIEVTKNIEISKKDYKKLKKNYNEINEKILKLESIKEQYRVNIENLKVTVSKVKELDDVKEFYNQVLKYFPDDLAQNYDDSLEFYQFMLSSRGRYFNERIDKVSDMISSLEEKKKKIENEIDKQVDTLQSTTVVGDINNILQMISDKNKELSDVTTQIEQYDSKDQIINEIDELQQEIITKTNMNREVFQSYKDIVTNAQIRFNQIVEETYNESGSLLIEFNSKTGKKDTTGRIKFTCNIKDDQSHGRSYMKINMFDLTWLLQRVEYNYPIQFLIHDGSYVKPDNNKAKYKLLSFIDNYLKDVGRGQYFVTMNIGELEEEDIKNIEDKNFIVAKLDNEKTEDRFMGIKYE